MKGHKMEMQNANVRINTRMVPDPSMTDAEFIHQRANKAGPNVGKVLVEENAMTRIGALCFVRRRLQHHEMAAEEFKSLYEARYGAGTPAMDPGRVQVDTTPIAHDSGMAAKLDRTARLGTALTQLGVYRDTVIAVVVLGIPAGEGLYWRERVKAVDVLLAGLDILAEAFGLKTRAA